MKGNTRIASYLIRYSVAAMEFGEGLGRTVLDPTTGDGLEACSAWAGDKAGLLGKRPGETLRGRRADPVRS